MPGLSAARCAGVERRPAVVRKSRSGDPAARHPSTAPPVGAPSPGTQAGSVRAQVEHRPPAARLGRKRQQGESKWVSALDRGFVALPRNLQPACSSLSGTTPASYQCSSTRSTWLPSRPSPGLLTSTACWRQEAAPLTAASAFGTP